MYVCLCKALTETDVAECARGCALEGVTSTSEVLRALDLEGDEACGFCAENPCHILAIVEDELELHVGLTRPNEEPVAFS
jgi:bacterioferritin-associated ferredoxin